MKAIKNAQLTVARSNFLKDPLSTKLNLSYTPPSEFTTSFPKSSEEVRDVFALNKKIMQCSYETLFSHRCVGNIAFTEYDIYAYGNQGYLSGYLEDDYGGLDLALERFEKHKTDAVVLSELSPFQLNVCINQELGYMNFGPLVEDRQAFVKQILRRFHKDISHANPIYYKDKRAERMLIYYIDPIGRRRITHVPLSAGIWAAEQRLTKVILGAPHPFLVHEDLSLNLEYDRLRDIWNDMTKSYIIR